MPRNKIAWFALVVFGLSVPAAAELRVLFLGNSLTSGQGTVAQAVRFMAQHAGEPQVLVTEVWGPPGWTLAQHVADPLTPARIADGEWDWVVLQEQTSLPLSDPASFHQAVEDLEVLIRGAGARTLLFSTWAHAAAPGTQTAIDAAYCQIAATLDARVSPVGMAWALTRQVDPTIDLYQADGRHQNAAGQYLTGLVFYRMFYGRDPIGFAPDITASTTVSAETAVVLQGVAAAVGNCPFFLFEDFFELGTTQFWDRTTPPVP